MTRQTKLICFALLLLTSTWATAQQQSETVTKSYAVQRQSVKQVAGELQNALGQRVTITADETNGQIIVVAPRSVHDQLENVFTSAPPPPRAATAAAIAKTITLQHAAPQTVGQTIQRLFNGRARAQISPDRKQSTITVLNGNGQPVRFTIHYLKKQVTIQATVPTVAAWTRLIAAIDRPVSNNGQSTQFVSLSGKRISAVQRAMKLIELRNLGRPATAGPPQRRDIVQWEQGRPTQTTPPRPDVQIAQNPPAAAPQPPPGGATVAGDDAAAQEGLLGPVQIEYLEGLDVIVLRGNKRDVERVEAIIAEIENLAVVTEPSIEVLDLLHVDSQAMADLVTPLYDAVLSPRQGQVSITALVQPNSLLLVGRAESVRVVSELVKKLDQPTAPDAQFHVFRLKYMSAAEAEETITEFYEERGGLGARVRVTSDFRSNAVIVQASPRDAAEVGKLIAQMDVEESSAVDAVRVFRLRFSLADELAPVLQQALRGDQFGVQGGLPGGGGFGGGGAGGIGAGGVGGTGAQQTAPRSSGLSFTTVDTEGNVQFRSGVLSGVIVTADTQSNTLIVRGPEKSMPLIEALIRQLDELPSEDAEIKVFTIVNGDALLLSDVLNGLFGNQITTGGFQQQANQAGLGESPLVPLRFSVDERTNSIVASGSIADLRVVEAILLRLDEDDVRQRQSVVFRLRYAPAIDVANAINEFLRSERQIQDVAPNTLSPFQQIEREVVVVPEPVSNSLIVSATPRYFQEVYGIVKKLDERPPMVMIQVLIAEVELDNFAEFGVELGGQDPLLFDRGILTDSLTGNTELNPGFPWNNLPLGNSGSAQSLATRNRTAAQGLSNFAVDRVNDELGFGGLVLSVSSDAVSSLLRALEQDKRAEILSRPQVMTLDNQPAFVQVGQKVPRITSSQITTTGTINNTVLENVGIVLGVTPRISPDGLVVMEVDAERSRLDDVDSGIPISINIAGDVIRSPIINIQTAQTTVSARNGQTVILGGLITEQEDTTYRGVPYLSNVPILGDLFRYESYGTSRFELLIILTPYIIEGDDDVNCINQMETERMSWCLSDVYRVHGYFDVNACQEMIDGTWQPNCMEIYPDESPSSVDFPTPKSTDDYFKPEIFPEGARTPAGTKTEPIPTPPKNSLTPPPLNSGAAGARPAARAAGESRQATPAALQVQPASAVEPTLPVSRAATGDVERAGAFASRDSAFVADPGPAATQTVQHWAPGSIGRSRAVTTNRVEPVGNLHRTPIIP